MTNIAPPSPLVQSADGTWAYGARDEDDTGPAAYEEAARLAADALVAAGFTISDIYQHVPNYLIFGCFAPDGSGVSVAFNSV